MIIVNMHFVKIVFCKETVIGIFFNNIDEIFQIRIHVSIVSNI